MARHRARPNERLSSHIYWLVCRNEQERRDFTAKLRAAGIHAVPHYPNLHLSAYAREKNWVPAENLPVTEHTVAGLIRLPLYTAMTEAEIARVVRAVKDFLR